MPDAVRAVVAEAGSPARLRGELRRRTAPLGALRRAIAEGGALGGPLPAELVDGGLAPVLSGRLRALLSCPEAPTPARMSAYRRASPPPLPLDVPPGPPQRPAEQPAAVPVGRGALSAGAAPGRRAQVTPAFETSTGSARGVLEPPGADSAAPSTLLRTRLREYWALERRLVMGQEGDGKNSGHAIREPAPSPPTGPRAVARGTRGSSFAAPGHEVTRRVAVAPAAPRAGIAPFPEPYRDGAQPIEIRNEFHISVGGGADHGADELADRIAAVLREQALQHGIDLT
jgi:hypothetical protein